MNFNFSERHVHFQRRLRGVVCGTDRAAVNLVKKLHMKLRRTEGEPHSSLFFKIVSNSPTCGRLARVRVFGCPNRRQDTIGSAIRPQDIVFTHDFYFIGAPRAR